MILEPNVCVCVCPVGVYSDLAEGAVLLFTEVGGGVTHIKFSHDGNLLFAGFRKVCWCLECRQKDDTSLVTPEQPVEGLGYA